MHPRGASHTCRSSRVKFIPSTRLDATRGSWACWYSGKTLIEGCVDSEWVDSEWVDSEWDRW